MSDWIAGAFWITLLASVARALIAGDGLPLGLCLFVAFLIAPRVVADADASWDAHDAIEKARQQ